MAFIYKQPIHAKLLKGYYIVLAVCGKQFIKPCLQRFSCFLHLFNGKVFTPGEFQFFQSVFNFINLLTELSFLSFRGKRDFLKLTVTDDNGIIISCCDSCTEFFSIGSFKIFFCCYKKLGTWIKM